MTEYCRLCGELKDSYEIVASINDVEHSMEQKLRACCEWTTENAEHRLPHSVCTICIDKLDKCWLFLQSVHLAQKKLLEIFDCQIGNESETKPLGLGTDETLDDFTEHADTELLPARAFDLQNPTGESSKFQCHLCHKTFNWERSLKLHCSHQNRNKCKICSLEFCTIPDLNYHQIQGCEKPIDIDWSNVDCKPTVIDLNTEYHTESDINDFNENEQQTDYLPEQFDYDNETDSSVSFHQMNRKKRKRAKQSIGPAKCKICGKRFSNKSNLRMHQRTAHSLASLYNCKQCGQRFAYKRQLVAHRLMHPQIHGDLYECWLCHETFNEHDLFRKHAKIHVQNTDSHSEHPTFQCHLCHKTFEDQRSLRIHCRYQKRNKCEICSHAFCTAPDLREHKQRERHGLLVIDLAEVQNKVPVLGRNTEQSNGEACVFCGKCFSNKSNLRFHQRKAHALKYLYTCKLCGKPFAYKRELNAHRLTHVGIRDSAFECCLCHETFHAYHLLKGHMRIHLTDAIETATTDPSNFECRICHESFDSHRSLGDHYKKNKCETCSYAFCTALQLTVHQQQECVGPIDMKPTVDNSRSTVLNPNMEYSTKKDDSTKQLSNLQACEFCGKCFSNKSNLRYHQRNAHALKYLYTCKLCGKPFAYKRQLVAHRSAHADIFDSLFECWLCHETFDAHHLLEGHMRIHIIPAIDVKLGESSSQKKINYNKKRRRVGIFDCKICSRIYTSPTSLRYHQRHAHTLIDIYSCDMCDNQFEFKKELTAHRLQHSNDEIRNHCSECNRTFKTKAYLLGHRRSMHADEFKCDMCEMVFTVKSDLFEHRHVHIDRHLSCEYCDRKYWNKSNLLSHQRIAHLNIRPFVCAECGKRYQYESQLKAHQTIHSAIREYLHECWLCHKTFYAQHLLKRHMRIHMDIFKPTTAKFICELCGKELTQMSGLVAHMKMIHSNERPYKCKICGLGYKTKHLLSVHLVSHTEYEFKCTICEKLFRQKRSLEKHMEYHSGTIVKPFVCDVCDKPFRRNFDLTEHRRIHTHEKPFKCEHCTSTFRTMSSFYSHLKKIHGISVSALNREKQIRETEMT